MPQESWSAEAFMIEIDNRPIISGWGFVSVAEAPETASNIRHLVVELKNSLVPLKIKIHTLLDGTSVLTRWLDIVNLSQKTLTLSAVFPWSGRLWYGKNFTLGYFTKDIWACEGWFEWKTLPLGATEIKCDKGQGHKRHRSHSVSVDDSGNVGEPRSHVLLSPSIASGVRLWVETGVHPSCLQANVQHGQNDGIDGKQIEQPPTPSPPAAHPLRLEQDDGDQEQRRHDS